MKVEIWSDIMCPFCYIGKRKFEAALEQFPGKDKIEVEWKSFQLNPALKSQPDKDVYDYVAEMKGQSRDWSLSVHAQLTNTAKEVGLTYNFDKAVIANSFDAHRLIQLAKKHQLGDAAEERLFTAYFTEGKDMSNQQTLLELGAEIGLDKTEVAAVLQSNDYAAAVNEDVNEAQQLGIRGVPFFVLDRKLGVSGAQPVEAFSKALEQAFTEWKKTQPVIELETLSGQVCTPDGECN
ncbi:putative DsbA family dithiol-disulfide isomerase [Chitinophaga niastensis]|uniref:Putative DsbA family dithiol-disulfide isomerase n=1 Tax=Chitinophaga niastensis TaxID=536980 RepID=A0A2P8HC48_CHINA|nr:DsbA family oxidoreductase [Chitinophaga niastensis]PSL43806.1 putative DsbA family dithiol-disulfide isomerase [Chitinophaga niastensis]